MLLPILLSLFWAVCSTILIQPWFWKGIIKRKTLIGDENNRGFSNNEKHDYRDSILLQVFFFIVTFGMSLLMYLGAYTRYNLYGSIIPILLVLSFQCITIMIGYNSLIKIKSCIIGVIAVIYLFFSFVDYYTTEEFDVVGMKKSEVEVPIVFSTPKQEENSKILSGSIVANLFGGKNASGPVYSNGKFVYTLTDSSNGYGIVVIDEYKGETAKFIACDFKFEMSLKLRQKYPFSRIKDLNVVISDDSVPFGKYAILSKPSMFGAPVLEKYVLQNMLSGEFIEYTAETLPKFAE